jgi:Holliday junction resolvase
MSNELAINVTGIPAPQGSKKGFPIRRANGTLGVAMTESAGESVKNWRQDVRTAAMAAATEATWVAPAGAAVVSIHFYLPRPKGHYGTGRNAGILKTSAPTHPTVKPDGDKLERATLDALTSAGVVTDDARIISSAWWKSYADARPAGARITITAVEEP